MAESPGPPMPEEDAEDCGRPRGCSCIGTAALAVALVLLGAVIFPVLFGRGSDTSRQTHCGSNLKQIGMALLVYAADYDDHACPPILWTDRLEPYMKDRSLYICPSAPELPVGYVYGRHLAGLDLGTLNESSRFSVMRLG